MYQAYSCRHVVVGEAPFSQHCSFQTAVWIWIGSATSQAKGPSHLESNSRMAGRLVECQKMPALMVNLI
jgi:hypothetical protein